MGFYASYDSFFPCLNTMGYDPCSEKSNRFYGTGVFNQIDLAVFTAVIGIINPNPCHRGYKAGKSVGGFPPVPSTELDDYSSDYCDGGVDADCVSAISDSPNHFVGFALGVIDPDHPNEFGCSFFLRSIKINRLSKFELGIDGDGAA